MGCTTPRTATYQEGRDRPKNGLFGMLFQSTRTAAARLLALGARERHLDVVGLRMRVMAGDCFGWRRMLLVADRASEGGDGDYFCHRCNQSMAL